ncbi:type II toxin-antitoxin system RelE/ParE family toxin [Oleiharenicola sp. Vm1]|uniref:type II toxin-antitoxin system RelE/ParE family toxin n=1 Tax=Oleiharenicola sp. Vm1 TaxID=3398393 RepID=UPI0039F4E091
MNRWFHPEFETDLIAAARFYETQRPHLGAEFIAEAEAAVETIMSAPLCWPARIGGVRRFLLPRFPYLIRYRVTPDTVQFLSILHGARNPETASDR